jgi:hypothetical protein
MGTPVCFESLASAVEGLMFEWRACFNTETGAIDTYDESGEFDSDRDEEEDFDGPEWIHVPFPDEDDDWRAMRDFAAEQQGSEAREELWYVLNGPRPFASFRAAVRRRGLEQAWFAYEAAAMRRELRAWLELNGIAFAEDATAPSA